jgi:hypothetical protein
MLAQGLNLILVVQHARSIDNEIDLFLAVVKYGLAIAMPVQRDFAEASYALQGSVLFVPLAENSPVVTSWRGQTCLGLREVWNVAMQPCGVCLPLLRPEAVCQQQQEQKEFSHLRCSRPCFGFRFRPDPRFFGEQESIRHPDDTRFGSDQCS